MSQHLQSDAVMCMLQFQTMLSTQHAAEILAMLDKSDRPLNERSTGLRCATQMQQTTLLLCAPGPCGAYSHVTEKSAVQQAQHINLQRSDLRVSGHLCCKYRRGASMLQHTAAT